MLRRIAEEAAVFAKSARDVVSEETLTHRWASGPSRFKPRVGAAAMERPAIRYQSREIVSEYGYGSLAESPNVLREIRSVTAVDGRKIAASEKARQTLSLGLRGKDDSVKKQLLKDFQKHGLKTAATDFGQILLMFSKRRIGGFQFRIAEEKQHGPDTVVVLKYEETSGRDSLTVFEGRDTIYQPMVGEVWVRKQDYVPVRIVVNSQRFKKDKLTQWEATIDYSYTALGVVLPAVVVYKELTDGEVIAENSYRYAPFRRFGAEVEVKFDTIDSPPGSKQEQPKK
jgi:hypothetical protein